MAVVTAGTAITGTLVWFGSRGTIEPIDVIEIWQAASERAMATQYSTNGQDIVTQTYRQMYVGGADPSGRTWVQNTTNGARTNAYVSVTWSNAVATFTNLPGTFRVAPPYFYWTFHDSIVTQRYIWGAWSNVTLSGVTLQTNYNGAYTFKRRTLRVEEVANEDVETDGIGPIYQYDMNIRAMIDEYTNTIGMIFYDCGPIMQSPLSTREFGPSPYRMSDYAGMSAYPFARMEGQAWSNRFFVGLYGYWGAATLTPGALDTTRVRDAGTYVAEVQRNPFVGMPWYSTQITIADTLRSATTEYVNDALTNSAGVFAGYSNGFPPMLTVTGTFKRITGAVTNLFPNESPVSYVLNTNDLKLRYDYAEVLRRTHAHNDQCTWTTYDTNAANQYAWYVTGTNWDSVVSNYTTNASAYVTVTTNTFANKPEITMQARNAAGTYILDVSARRATLQCGGFSTNFPLIGYDAYVYTAGPTASSNDVFDAYGVAGASNNVFLSFSRAATNVTSGQLTVSGYAGSTNQPPFSGGTFVDSPDLHGGADVNRGWKGDDKDIVLEWGFNYATNDP
jgi:hypothetical protein